MRRKYRSPRFMSGVESEKTIQSEQLPQIQGPGECCSLLAQRPAYPKAPKAERVRRWEEGQWAGAEGPHLSCSRGLCSVQNHGVGPG